MIPKKRSIKIVEFSDKFPSKATQVIETSKQVRESRLFNPYEIGKRAAERLREREK